MHWPHWYIEHELLDTFTLVLFIFVNQQKLTCSKWKINVHWTHLLHRELFYLSCITCIEMGNENRTVRKIRDLYTHWAYILNGVYLVKYNHQINTTFQLMLWRKRARCLRVNNRDSFCLREEWMNTFTDPVVMWLYRFTSTIGYDHLKKQNRNRPRWVQLLRVRQAVS